MFKSKKEICKNNIPNTKRINKISIKSEFIELNLIPILFLNNNYFSIFIN